MKVDATDASGGSAFRAGSLALAAAWLGALACCWIAWCEFPFYWWNEVRLVPAFALRTGLNPYPALGGGPLLTWIYGPIGIIGNLPATLAHSAAGALHAASLINAAVMLGPLALIFFGSKELRRRGPSFSWFALAMGILLLPRFALAQQVADHYAIAAGLLANWCLVARPGPSQRQLVLAAAMSTLALWSKQIAVFLVVAHLVFLAREAPRGAALRYFAWFVVFSLAALAVFTAMFGFGNLWLNLVAIPGRLPWAVFVPRLLMRWPEMLLEVLGPLAGLVFLRIRGWWPADSSASSRFFRSAVLTAIVTLPVGLLAYFKVGGDMNLLYTWYFLLPAALLTWLVNDHAKPGTPGRLLAATIGALSLHVGDFVSLPLKPFTGHLEAAAGLEHVLPHSIWFPQNPLITFYADRRLWHSEDGIVTRNLAGYGLRKQDFLRYLPPKLRAVVYPSANVQPFAIQLLPQFTQSIHVNYWTVYLPAPPAPAPENKVVAQFASVGREFARARSVAAEREQSRSLPSSPRSKPN